MKSTSKNTAPPGYSTVCPYLMVHSVEKQLEFLEQVFGAQVTERKKQPDGAVMHGEARIGDTLIMVGKARDSYPPQPSMNYVFVADVDLVYQKALDNGAISLMAPTDQAYGNRDAGVKDSQGNQWWMAQPLTGESAPS